MAEFIVNEPAGVPPKLTAVAVLKPVPVITIDWPMVPPDGAKVLTVGVLFTVAVTAVLVADTVPCVFLASA